VHTLLALSALFLVLLVGALALRLLPRLTDWEGRRQVQLLVLAAPVVSLGVGLGALSHFAGPVCFVGAPSWDYTLGVALPLGMAGVALCSLALGLVRLALMARIFAYRGTPAHPELLALADRMAGQVGAPQPRVFPRSARSATGPRRRLLAADCPALDLDAGSPGSKGAGGRARRP